MYERLKRLYVAGKLSDTGLSNAVIKGWITENQRQEIVAAKKKNQQEVFGTIDTDVAVKLENHEQQIKSLKHRMDEQEEQGKSFSSLALSVQKLALSMESMIDEQKNQGERLLNWNRSLLIVGVV